MISPLPLVSRIMCAMMHAKAWMTNSCWELHIYWGVGLEMYFLHISLSLPYSLSELSPRLLEFLMAMRVTLRSQREERRLLLGFINNANENNDDSVYNSNNQYIYN